MDRILSKQKVNDYLQALVEKNADLVHFVGTDPKELDDLSNSHDGIQGPLLNFYAYRWKLTGNNQRTFNIRTIHFAVLIPVKDINDVVEQNAAVTRAEEIGLEVLSYVYQDSQLEATGWLYKNMDKDAITAEEIRPEGSGNEMGMDFTFDLRVQEPLVVDKAKWSDGDKFC